MSDPTDTGALEGAADPPQAEGLAAEMAQMRERLAAYEAAESQRKREQAEADAKLLDEADALTRVQAEREQLKAELEAQGGVLAELAKSQIAGLALDAGTKALLKGLPAKDQLDWVAKHGANYRRDAAPATRTAAEGQADYSKMSSDEVAAAVTVEARKHNCRPSDLRVHNPELHRAYTALMN